MEKIFSILLAIALFLFFIKDLFIIVAVVAGICLLILGIWSIIKYFLVERYFNGEKFQLLKEKLTTNIERSNELNNHIEELKVKLYKHSPIDYGKSQYSDNSVYAYKRPHIPFISNNTINEYFCSLSVCRNAQNQPFKYMCKYFNIEANENTLNYIESICNDFSAAKDGENILIKEREDLEKNYTDLIPAIIRKYYMQRFYKELGFLPINNSNNHFPKYSFKYISAAGNSSLVCDIILDLNNLERFSSYLFDRIKLTNSIKYQRTLMTRRLRKEIMSRDNYTCQNCGLSLEKEPNLLLEIDHIIPISKNGKTTYENLQTLCWKCNRQKGNKLIDQSKSLS